MFNGSGKPIDRGPSVLAEDYLDIMGMTLFLLFYSANQICERCFGKSCADTQQHSCYLGCVASSRLSPWNTSPSKSLVSSIHLHEGCWCSGSSASPWRAGPPRLACVSVSSSHSPVNYFCSPSLGPFGLRLLGLIMRKCVRRPGCFFHQASPSILSAVSTLRR